MENRTGYRTSMLQCTLRTERKHKVCRQTWMWGEEERLALLPKTKGSGLMVSDFIEEHDG